MKVDYTVNSVKAFARMMHNSTLAKRLFKDGVEALGLPYDQLMRDAGPGQDPGNERLLKTLGRYLMMKDGLRVCRAQVELRENFDGIWLHVEHEGKHAGILLSTFEGPIVKEVLVKWAAKQLDDPEV
jgi:hypothetical protein